jgi:hypothetical protein
MMTATTKDSANLIISSLCMAAQHCLFTNKYDFHKPAG